MSASAFIELETEAIENAKKASKNAQQALKIFQKMKKQQFGIAIKKFQGSAAWKTDDIQFEIDFNVKVKIGHLSFHVKDKLEIDLRMIKNIFHSIAKEAFKHTFKKIGL